jgi:hypothetical protein
VKSITEQELAARTEGAEVLAERRGRAKVFRGADGRMYKLFPARLHWSIRGPVRPARRFSHNARRLAARGVACPSIAEVLHVAGQDRDVVVYEPLEGSSLRDTLRATRDPAPLRGRLARYKAHLHGLGIYFAAGHMGNYIVRPDGTLGLIDVHDLWISRVRLGALHRARSFRILLKYPEDRALLGGEAAVAALVEEYLPLSGLAAFERRLFLRSLRTQAATDARAGQAV